MNVIHYFIPTYNKAAYVPTFELLRSFGIVDNVYLVVGDDDPALSEYVSNPNYNVLVFSKTDYADEVDSIGTYAKTLKVCTYARAFVDDYAKRNNIRFICLLFDDIMSMQLRYVEDDKVKSTRDFNLAAVFDEYIELLKSSPSIYMVGPPGSSFYIGIHAKMLSGAIDTPCSHYGNVLLYDTQKPIGPYKASILEDMSIVLYNSMVGHLGMFPFGLQVNCRPPRVTNDAYVGIGQSEYIQQLAILTGTPVNPENLQIPYARYIPKVISDQYRKER